jgi:peptidoglycan/LPS O-acetylase OafA/YrhL
VHGLSRQQLSARVSSADTFLGNASYGIFLNHFLLIWVLGLEQPQHLAQWVTLVLTSMALAILTQHLVERPILQLRRKWRKKNKIN